MSIDANMCGCCKEIWNQTNLKAVALGEHNLYLCPDCFKEYEAVIQKAYADGQKNPVIGKGG